MNMTSPNNRTAERRLEKELREFPTDPNIAAGPIDDTWFNWQGVIFGPEGTPYSGAVFFLSVVFPRDYPFQPPVVRFADRIYHCSINDGHERHRGTVSLDILSDGPRGWFPCYNLHKVLQETVALLQNPEANYCSVWAWETRGREMQELFTNDRAQYDENAAEYAREHAEGPGAAALGLAVAPAAVPVAEAPSDEADSAEQPAREAVDAVAVAVAAGASPAPLAVGACGGGGTYGGGDSSSDDEMDEDPNPKS